MFTLFGSNWLLCLWYLGLFGIQNGEFGIVWSGEFVKINVFQSGGCAHVAHHGDQISVMGKAEGQWVSRFLAE